MSESNELYIQIRYAIEVSEENTGLNFVVEGGGIYLAERAANFSVIAKHPEYGLFKVYRHEFQSLSPLEVLAMQLD